MNDDGAFQIDPYLDRLLSGPSTALTDAAAVSLAEASAGETSVAEAEGSMGAVLQRTLVRFHPSFAFEERLATRLREAAGQDAAQPAVTGQLIAFPGAQLRSGRDPGRAAERRSRGLLVGGAIASGVIASGVSLAGAALFAWRRARVDHRWERLG